MFLRFLYIVRRIQLAIMRPVLFGVRVMLVKDGRVIIIRHTYRKGWFLPGGGLKGGETVEEAARREVREETGAEMGEVRLVGIFTSYEEGFSGHNILFACEDFEIVGQPDHEIAETRAVGLDEFPDGLFRGHREKIESYLKKEKIPSAGLW